MQILERTGIRIANRLQWPLGDFYGEMLFDPALALRYASWYLRELWNDLGHPILAMGAYNGGPTRMRAHMSAHQEYPFDVMVEEFGAHESRNYMRKVADHFIRYLAVYGSTQEWDLWISKLMPPRRVPTSKETIHF
jgi:soluble lytic murein transglycosylase-like protein